jgi:hypothetical protein
LKSTPTPRLTITPIRIAEVLRVICAVKLLATFAAKLIFKVIKAPATVKDCQYADKELIQMPVLVKVLVLQSLVRKWRPSNGYYF